MTTAQKQTTLMIDDHLGSQLDGVAGGWKIGIEEARRKNPNNRVFNVQEVARCRPHNMFQCARCHPDKYPDGFK